MNRLAETFRRTAGQELNHITADPSPDDVLDISDVMKLLKASRSKVQKLAKRKEITAFKLGTGKRCGWRFHRRDVTAYILSMTNTAGMPAVAPN